ncbi:unnamed protein product [Pylaiella littoralis]
MINRLLLQPFGVQKGQEAITLVVHEFLGANRDPTAAPKQQQHGEVGVADDMRVILAALQSESIRKSPLLVLLLKVLKVLLRKPSNRKTLGRPGVQVVAALMSSACVDTVSCECANVVLNMCYDTGNVQYFLEVGGVETLGPLIRSGNEHLKASRKSDASGLGALQSVCFDKPGRDATRDSGIIHMVVGLLEDDSAKVRARALGTVHNLSTDARSIGIIRKEGGLPRLVRLLRSHEAQVCGGAAGTIQNLSREEKCRALLLNHFGVVEPLADLLVGRHVKSQISAAGALVNIVGPDAVGSKRELLHSVLADGIVLGVIESCLA